MKEFEVTFFSFVNVLSRKAKEKKKKREEKKKEKRERERWRERKKGYNTGEKAISYKVLR